MAALFRGAEQLAVRADAFQPVMQTEQVGEAHAAVAFGRQARDLAADLAEMGLGVAGGTARVIKCPAALSAINVQGILSCSNSQAVNLAPCNQGRVSLAYID